MGQISKFSDMSYIYNIIKKPIFVFLLIIYISLYLNSHSVSATSSLDLSISSSTISINFTTANSSGTFKSSNVNLVSARTDNTTGYTLSIVASDSTYPQSLKNIASPTDTSLMLNTISDEVAEADFSSLVANNNINNKWGYYFIPHGSINNGNHIFSPAPTTTDTIIDITASANSEYNQYDLAFGARIDQTVRVGSYANSYIVRLVSNAIPYTIIYNDSSITNMPTDISSTSPTSSVDISANIPKKIGYTFIGWCDTAPVVSTMEYSCTGTTYSPSDPYILDQVGGTNNLHFYTMWRRNTMQNVSEWKDSLNIGDETTAIDTRDGKTYSVAKYCVNYSGDTCTATQIWMTQNLDLVLGRYGVRTLTSNDSDINTNPGSAMGYSTSGTTITWTPNSTLNVPAYITNYASGSPSNSLSGWTNSVTAPYQAEGGDYYVFTSGNDNDDTIYSSLTACIAGGHTAELCQHYHVGNYYNWTAAVASNNSNTTNYNTNFYIVQNSICPKGWRLPNGLTGDSSNPTISEYNQLAYANGITSGTTNVYGTTDEERYVDTGWTTNGFNNFRSSFTNSHGDYVPMYFVRSGLLYNSVLYYCGNNGNLWSSTARTSEWGYDMDFLSGGFHPASQDNRGYGWPVRCLVR